MLLPKQWYLKMCGLWVSVRCLLAEEATTPPAAAAALPFKSHFCFVGSKKDILIGMTKQGTLSFYILRQYKGQKLRYKKIELASFVV
jgi:hypothetical protein